MKRLYFLLMSTLFTVVTFAQTGSGGSDVKVDVTKTTSTSSGMAGIPWMWIIIGVVVLIILIVALSSRRGTDVVERRNTTVIKD